MAYLKNFKRFLASKKVLRLLATKLQLHKLQRSYKLTGNTRRKIKKHPTTTTTAATKGGGTRWLSLSFQSRFKRKRRDVRRYPRKKTKPVYVDHLFLETKRMEVPAVAERIGGNAVEGTSKGGGGGGGVADEMWESLAMGTSQMDGINERAEEFISKFRADLLVQEIMARRL